MTRIRKRSPGCCAIVIRRARSVQMTTPRQPSKRRSCTRQAPITPWPAGTGYGDFEAKAKALQPHIVRIFYNDNWDGNRNGLFPDWEKNYASFVEVGDR